MIVKKGIAKVVLIGNEKEIKSLAGDIDLEGVMIEDSLKFRKIGGLCKYTV